MEKNDGTMTATCIDGPAKGVRLELRQLPILLRVVQDRAIWVYRRVGLIRGFACGTHCIRVFGAEYELHARQPDLETLREKSPEFAGAETRGPRASPE